MWLQDLVIHVIYLPVNLFHKEHGNTDMPQIQMRKLLGQHTESSCAAFGLDMSLIPYNLVKTGEQWGSSDYAFSMLEILKWRDTLMFRSGVREARARTLTEPPGSLIPQASLHTWLR